MVKLILASASPRRKELLAEIYPDFETEPAVSPECVSEDLSPSELVRALARQKAEEVFFKHPDAVVLGADTVVSFRGTVLGKPKDAQDAINTLKTLSGQTHSVYTGWCICTPQRVINGVCRSDVTFNPLSDELICDYVATGSPLDKAGSYGIQDSVPLVEKYSGSFSNIVGLPTEEIRAAMHEIGVLK